MTLQDKAIADAEWLQRFAGRVKSLYLDAVDFKSRSDQADYLAVWQAQPTASWNGDGTPAAADGTPNIANPITTQDLNIRANDLIGGAYFINQFIDFMTGVAITDDPAIVQNERINTLVNS